MSTPRVAVIVPTCNRLDSLRCLLDSLGSQAFADFEVVIVDDSPQRSADLSGSGERLSVQILRTGGVGAVEARCMGVESTTAEILAFTDDDCIVDPDWLRAGVAAIDAGADVAQGQTLPQREPRPLERTVTHDATDGLFPTCNVFYRRSAYESAGGFDRSAADRLGFRGDRSARALGFGEDTLLGWAVARAGRPAAVPEAIVRHDVVRPPLRELFWRAWATGAFPRLVGEVPELRRTLVKKSVVLGTPDARLYAYGLVLVPVRALRFLGIAAGVWWICSRAGRVRKGSHSVIDLVTTLPVTLALDLTRSAALVIGSIRARTPVI